MGRLVVAGGVAGGVLLGSASVAAAEAPVVVSVEAGSDGRGLRISSPVVHDEVIDLGAGVDAVVVWDLTSLDPRSYASDLVRVEVVDANSPEGLTVVASAAHDRTAVVLDGRPGGASVVQLGRRTEHRLHVEGAGRQQVRLRASIPLAGGGHAEAEASVILGSGVSVAAPRAAPAGRDDDGDIVIATELPADGDVGDGDGDGDGDGGDGDGGDGDGVSGGSGRGDGEGLESQGPAGSASASSLAVTGVDIAPMIALALGLLAVGYVGLVVARRLARE